MKTAALLMLLTFPVSLFTACAEADTETTPETIAMTTVKETEPVTTAAPVTTAEPVEYYVMAEYLPGERKYGTYGTLEEAVAMANKRAQLGCRVYTNKGECVYLPYTQLQCDILKECKRVADYVRKNDFVYGDAPKNPAKNHDAKKVSCDRFVCWVMYNVGFVKQPTVQGVVVSQMAAWCEKQGFEKITSVRKLEPGDIILTNPNSAGVAGHTFIYAGATDEKNIFYRYDCGSNTRIQSAQPFSEGISTFICAYRPS